MREVARCRVRFDETDQQGVVHHGEYFGYFEVTRVEFFRQVGFDIRDLEASGLSFVVVEASARYRKPARFDDELRLSIGVEGTGTASLTLTYEIARGVEVLAEGHTRLACLNDKGRPARLPDDFKAAVLAGDRGEASPDTSPDA